MAAGVMAEYTVRVRGDGDKRWVEYVTGGEILLVSKEYTNGPLSGTPLFLNLVQDTLAKIKAETVS